MMNKVTITSKLALGGILILACAAATQVYAASGKPAVLWPAGDITWVDNPTIKGAKMAVLWGDPKTGEYGAFRSIPGGNTLALHTHTHDQKVIVMSGTVVLTLEGGAAKEMGAGSYAFIPGGARHTAQCKTGADCVYFEEAPGASDIKFVDAAAAKK